MIDFKDVQDAYERLQGVVKCTPLNYSKSFSRMADANVYLKLENLQTTGSFKIRGAYNKISRLGEAGKEHGVVCSSAGNHAQGVAYASTHMGIKSTVYMPVFAPPLKVIATRSYGANVVQEGATYDDAYLCAREYEKKTGAIFVPAFNDDYVIAGQGTIGIEIYNGLKDVEFVFVPVGGGGLISGVATALKHMKPGVKIIGVEAEGSQSMKLSIDADKVIPLTDIATIADGIAVKTPGDKTFELVKKYVDEIVTVNDEEIANAVYLLLQRGKILAEPAAAVSLAAILNKKCRFEGKNVVALISGGNINMGLLTQIVERGMMYDGSLASISVIVPDKAGMLKDILSILVNLRANIQNISHNRSTTLVPVGQVEVTITFYTLGKEQLKIIEQELKKNNLKYSILR